MSKISNLIFHNEFHEVTSVFGPRKPIETKYGKTSDFHKGTDYGTNLKKIAQYAVEKGTILSTGTSDSCGNYIWINYPRLNVKMCHYHLDSICVKQGQAVDNNTLVGYTGTTGMSTGIHLHLGIFDFAKNDYVDPEKYNYVEGEKVNMKFEEGNKVIIKGDLYYGPNDKEPRGYTEEKVTEITRISEGSKHPYNTTGDLGWMNESDIKLYEEPVDTNDYKSLYEEEVKKNKILEEKINNAINVLQKA